MIASSPHYITSSGEYILYKLCTIQACPLNKANSPLCGAISYVKTSLLLPTPRGIVQESQIHNVDQNQYMSRIFASS